MIDFVKGTLVFAEADVLVVEAAGIGYRILTANPYRFQAQPQEQVIIYTYQYVREDTLALYGFVSREERALFEKLLQVSGVGPKVALAILGAGSSVDIVRSIQEENHSFLTQLPGIGKKTAQRLILELKDKLDDVLLSEKQLQQADMPDGKGDHGQRQERALDQREQVVQEAMEALRALGYAENEVRRVTPQLREYAAQEKDTESCVRFGLQLLLKT